MLEYSDRPVEYSDRPIKLSRVIMQLVASSLLLLDRQLSTYVLVFKETVSLGLLLQMNHVFVYFCLH